MMKSAALLTLGLLAACYPATAKPLHGHRYAARTTHHAHVVRHAIAARRENAAHHAIASIAEHASNAHAPSEQASHAGITCEMVRAYVAQVGLAQAAAMAESAGITPSEKARAKRCLEQKS
jgi:hypothetical protein